ncbi:uncharacterized protein LOC132750483 [Ruditapes philippinarum]|uniref:uncharacterized protein LOC132750483 n=1 Tax=Ruditapes philippinarum TaxID=129788 RepID=UPI00295BDD96|nr:uncharacterized protein LOC132750483 [Ruditapes philippinarum]
MENFFFFVSYKNISEPEDRLDVDEIFLYSYKEPYFWDYSYMNITEPAGDLYLTPVTPRPYMFPETDEVFCDSPGAAVSPDFIPYTCPPAGCFYYLATEEADSVFHPNCYSPGCESPRLPLRNMQCW